MLTISNRVKSARPPTHSYSSQFNWKYPVAEHYLTHTVMLSLLSGSRLKIWIKYSPPPFIWYDWITINVRTTISLISPIPVVCRAKTTNFSFKNSLCSYNQCNHTLEWPWLVRVAPVYWALSLWTDVLAHPMKTIYTKGYSFLSHTDNILISMQYHYWHLIEQRAGKWGRQLRTFNLSLRELDLHPSTLMPWCGGYWFIETLFVP